MLRYQGRIDFQVKFIGFRIELQDIEANIQNLKEIEKAVVLPKTNDQHKVDRINRLFRNRKKHLKTVQPNAPSQKNSKLNFQNNYGLHDAN